MVWDGGSKPLVVPKSWALLGVTLGRAPVWPSSGGVGFKEKSVVRRPPCYLPRGQLITNGQNDYVCILIGKNYRSHIFFKLQQNC